MTSLKSIVTEAERFGYFNKSDIPFVVDILRQRLVQEPTPNEFVPKEAFDALLRENNELNNKVKALNMRIQKALNELN